MSALKEGEGPFAKPMFYEILEPYDQKLYEELQSTVGSSSNRYNRNKRIATFQEMLDHIRKYCERGDGDDWKRYLVCGVCWMGSDIAINTRQLRVLIAKSKSSINGALAKMGYTTQSTKGQENFDLLYKIPFLKGHQQELRQWTIRTKMYANTPEEKEMSPPPSFVYIKEEKEKMKSPKEQEINFSYDWSSDEPPIQPYDEPISFFDIPSGITNFKMLDDDTYHMGDVFGQKEANFKMLDDDFALKFYHF